MTSNTLEFFVKMKDLMSGGLVKLAQNSQQTFTKIKSHVGNAIASTKFMSNSIDELRYKLKQVNEVRFGTVMKSEFREATRSAKQLERQISRMEGKGRRTGSLGGAFGSLLPAIGLAAVTSFGASTVHAAMDFQATKIKYGVLTGNQKTGDQLAEQAQGLAQNTIMGTAVYDNAQKIMSFGVAANKVIPDLKMMGDISMGDANKLGRLTLAFGEVESQGKLTGQQFRQLTRLGFNPLQEISRTSGKSVEYLTEQMRKGKITSAMLEDSFKSVTSEGGRFNGMLDKVANTPLGRLKKLQGQFNLLKIDIGEALMPLAEFLMKTASFLMQHIEFVKAAAAAWLSYAIVSKASLVAESIAAGAALGPIGLIAAAVGAITLAWQMATNAQEAYNKVLSDNSKSVYDKEQEGIIGDIKALKKKNPKLTDSQATKIILDSETNLIATGMQENAMNLQRITRQYQAAKGRDVHGNLSGLKARIETLQGVQNNYISQKTALEDLKSKGISAADLSGGGVSTKGTNPSDVATGITSGGPRVININFKNMVEKMEIHATGVTEGLDDMERKVEEHFLRILNSGASVQG